MVVFEQKTRGQQKVSPEDAKIRIKHTKEWKDELGELFKDKPSKNLLKRKRNVLPNLKKIKRKPENDDLTRFHQCRPHQGQKSSGSSPFWPFWDSSDSKERFKPQFDSSECKFVKNISTENQRRKS